MILTMVVFLGVVVTTCIVGVVIIPRFDRRPALSPAASAADRRNATTSRDM